MLSTRLCMEADQTNLLARRLSTRDVYRRAVIADAHVDLLLELAVRERRLGETNVFASTWLPLLEHDDVDVDGAHLEPDATPLEEREPGRREDAALPEPPLAVRELEQQVDVGVGDHGATIDARRSGLTNGQRPVSLADLHTNRMETIVCQLTTPIACPR